MSNEKNKTSNGNDGKLLDAEKELQIKLLKDHISNIEKENTKLKILLKEYGCDESPSSISDEEAICVQQINRLRKVSETRDLSLDETRKLDLLQKNLKIARGEVIRGKKKDFSNLSTDDLLNKI